MAKPIAFLAFTLSLSLPALGQIAGLRVGVWNIEKLSTTESRGFPEMTGGDSLGPRTDSDLRFMARYIRDEVSADALMITEIDPDSPNSTVERPQSEQLNRICGYMGENWRYFLSKTGGEMRLGLLFNEDRVRLKKLVNLHAPEFPVAGKDVFDRDPFIVWIAPSAGGDHVSDLLLACVHLKSQQQPFRDNRMAAMAKLVGDLSTPSIRTAIGLPSQGEEPEILILGDCNDSSFKSPGFRYMFDYLEGVGFSHLRPEAGDYPHTRVNGSQIDHIFASGAAVDNLVVPGTFRVHGSPQGERARYRQQLSDHFPVTVDVAAEGTVPLGEEPLVRRSSRIVVEAVAPEEALPDDEDEGELMVRAEVVDHDFERILAPVWPSTLANAGDGAADTPENTAQQESMVIESSPEAPTGSARFVGEVTAAWLDEREAPDRMMRLTGDFAFIDDQGRRWDAPAGSVVDGASIPSVFWNKFIGPPFVGDYRKASVVHDVACDLKRRPHRETHRMFYEACLVGGVSEAKAKAMYWAVRSFGPRWRLDADLRTRNVEVRPTIEDLSKTYEVEAMLQKRPEMPIEELESLLDEALADVPDAARDGQR